MALLRDSSTQAARQAEWRAQARLRQAFFPPLFRALWRELGRTGRAAAAAYGAGGQQGVNLALAGHGERLMAILDPAWSRVARAFGYRTIDEAFRTGAVRGALEPPETKDVAEARLDFERALRVWIETEGAEQVTRISETTREQIMSAILAGVEENETLPEIQARIREVTAGAIGGRRARTIARTEIHNASTWAQDQSAISSGLENVTTREWITALDERTRESHIAASGQQRPHGEPFDVGGSKLMRPGDPNGPASEVVNCRCISALVVLEAAFGQAA